MNSSIKPFSYADHIKTGAIRFEEKRIPNINNNEHISYADLIKNEAAQFEEERAENIRKAFQEKKEREAACNGKLHTLKHVGASNNFGTMKDIFHCTTCDKYGHIEDFNSASATYNESEIVKNSYLETEAANRAYNARRYNNSYVPTPKMPKCTSSDGRHRVEELGLSTYERQYKDDLGSYIACTLCDCKGYSDEFDLDTVSYIRYDDINYEKNNTNYVDYAPPKIPKKHTWIRPSGLLSADRNVDFSKSVKLCLDGVDQNQMHDTFIRHIHAVDA